MQSFLKFINCRRAPVEPEWLEDPDTAYRSLDPIGKVVFMLGQSVMLNYLSRVYDGGMPLLINEYHQKVAEWWMLDLEAELKQLEGADWVGPQAEEARSVYLNILTLLGKEGTDLDVPLLVKYLSEYANPYRDQIPLPCKASFYSPYLQFAERARRSATMSPGDYAQSVESFQVNGLATIPLVAYQGDLLIVDADKLRFAGYKYDYADTHKFGQQPGSLGPQSIFSYWRGYNWRGYSFNGLVGVLLAQCLELDPNTYPGHSLQWGYAHVYRQAMQWKPYGEEGSNLWLSSDAQLYRRSILTFIADIRERYQVLLDDAELLSRLVQDTVEEADPLREYLMAAKPSDVSVEMLQAFQNSMFANYPELVAGNRSSSRALMEAAIQSNQAGLKLSRPQLDPSSSPSATLAAARPNSAWRSDSRYSWEAAGDADDPTRGDDDDTTAEENDTDNASPADTGDQDGEGASTPGATDVFGEPAPDAPDAENNPDAEPTAPNANPSGTEEDADTTHTNTPASTALWMDDKRGVELELNDRETVNSVLFKMELEAYIDSLLANPPKSLSIMKVETLKRIKAYWLHLLSMECVINLVNNIIKLPKHLNLQPKDNQHV